MDSYSEEELVNFFEKVLGINSCRSKLKSLDAQFVQEIYTTFLKDFNCPLEVLKQCSLDAPDNLHNHGQYYRYALFAKQLAQMVGVYLNKIAGVQDFSLSDILDPKKGRTMNFFTSFINFYMFCNDKLTLCKEIQEQVEMKVSDLENRKMAMEEGVNHLQNLKLKDAEFKIKLQQIQDQTNEEKCNLSEHLMEKETLQNISSQLKEKITKENVDFENKDFRIAEIKMQIDLVKQHIYTEEDKIEEKEKSEMVSKLKAQLNSMKVMLQSCSNDMQAYDNIVKNMDTCTCLYIQQLKAENEKLDELTKQHNEVEQKKTIALNEPFLLEREEQQLQSIITSKEETAKQLSTNSEKRIQSYESEKKYLLNTRAEYKKQSKLKLNAENEADAKCQMLKIEIQKVEQKTKASVEHIATAMQQIMTEATEEHKKDIAKLNEKSKVFMEMRQN